MVCRGQDGIAVTGWTLTEVRELTVNEEVRERERERVGVRE